MVSSSSAVATDCWLYDGNKTLCDSYSDCNWDPWGQFCHQVGCWDYHDQSSCDAAIAANLSCEWKTQGSSGWCEDAQACWYYNDNDTCISSGCTWDGSSYCAEINCWNYFDEKSCENHTDYGCSWDGWGCMESSGCWGYKDSTTCDSASNCKWRENEFCAEEGCWNYDSDQTGCEAAEGCEWQVDEWGSFCMESGSCWNYNLKTNCEGAGCYWDGNKCEPKDCFISSGTDNSTCTTNGALLGLSCVWHEECFGKGPGGENCWQHSTQGACDGDSNCDWGTCGEAGCWDYNGNQAACESQSGCTWYEYDQRCDREGCWDAKNATGCAAISGCTWMTGSGWCEEEECWNAFTESECDAMSGCDWQAPDQYNPDGYCFEQGCWSYNDQGNCTSNGCTWDVSYCYEPGCWDYDANQTACSSASNCEWITNGQCFEQGCWEQTNETGCTGAGCTWGGSGWCTDPGCWNFNTKTTCDNSTGCQWNDQWSYCEEINCWNFNTESACYQYNGTINCTWDGGGCNEIGCWNYNDNNDTCDAATGCSWNAQGMCYTKDCWNYVTNDTCIADTECNWSTSCYGDYIYSCWQWDENATGCAAQSPNCTWGGSCFKIGCGSKNTQTECCGSADCTENENSGCGWEDTGYCYDKGCWDYYNQNDCANATGCLWDSTNNYCYEEGCSVYGDATNCSQQSFRGCTWNEEYDYCYEKGCWDYISSTQCNANNASGCVWDSADGYCYKQGCWSYTTSDTCSGQSNCEWSTSGWCYDLGCWNYGTKSSCTDNHTACAWDSTYDYCYEKGCWDYQNENDCNSTSKCKWDTGGSYCYEEGCWNFMDNDTCLANSEDCFWDQGAGWCSETGCWDYYTNDTCLGDSTCDWDYAWGYCFKKGCWDYQNETSCETNDCYWDTGSGGWCYEEGCWDQFDQSECEAIPGCSWDSAYDYCYEEGCWKYDAESNSTGCNNDPNCQWRSDTWGWCEEVRCWDYFGNQSACENVSDSITCVWNDPMCEDVGCWIWDGQETNCTNETLTGQSNLNCTYSNGFCDPATGTCAQYDGNSKGCMDTFYCFYDWQTDQCKTPDTFNEQSFTDEMILFNPKCWLFDASNSSCGNVTICNYTATGSCDNKIGMEDDTVQCENITDMTLCNTLPALASCCKWRNGNCTTDYTDKSCYENVQKPPEGASFCEDYLSYTSENLCNEISGSPWFMPCSWDGKYCTFKMDDVVGSGGGFDDIKTESLCEKAKGKWTCDYYCDDNDTVNTTDDILRSECWCEIGSGKGKEICKKSCWACEYNTTGGAWSTLSAAETACETSPANCEFEENQYAENGFGYCDFKLSGSTGSCDKTCSVCNEVTDDPKTAKPEKKIACLESSADCKWAQNLANASIGTCVKQSEKTCNESCFKCTKAECSAYGLGSAGKCKWDSDETVCTPVNFANEEICFNGKDDDNDEMVDCDDSDCFFASECGEADMMHECWKYDNNRTLCGISPTIAGSPINCTWIEDPFGGQWCGHPSEICWQYDNNQTQCNNQGGACKYETTFGRCDMNKTKVEACFGKQEGACIGDCKWVDDPSNPFGGGWCESKMSAICHNSTITSQTLCTSGANSQYCQWMYDPNSDNGGFCEPKCFGLSDNNSCIGNSNCEWLSGWCEPNITTSEDCFKYDNTDASTCETGNPCVWSTAMFGGTCEPDYNGIYLDIKCKDIYWDQTSCDADDNCTWIEDPFSGKGGFCENTAFTCFDVGMKTLMQTGNSTLAEEACTNESAYGCVWNNALQECQSVCMYNTTVLSQDCATVAGCKSFTGWCDPKGANTAFQSMDTPPVIIGFDDCNEENKTNVTDICGMGVKDDYDTLGIGVRLRSMIDSATCNGEWVIDFDENTGQPSNPVEGNGETPVKVDIYLDSDGLRTGGCAARNGIGTGYDYKIILSSTTSEKEKISKYSCVNSEWKIVTLKVFTMAKVMCSEGHGAVIMIDKSSIKDAGNFDLSKDLYLYALAINSSTGTVKDTVQGVYTPGAVDFKVEDCSGFDDMDGDGLPPDKDPDCKFIKQFGGNVFEDCFKPGDEDMDGLTNCDDTDCAFMPECGGQVFDFEASGDDDTAPTVSRKEVNTFPDGAFIKYDTNEPANGTLIFYGNSSSCATINATIYDVGITDSSIPQYKMWHDGPIDQISIGTSLENATTYYYKLRVCDKKGNCGLSACTNFTTEASLSSCGLKCKPVFDVEYAPPEGDPFLGGVGMKWDFGSGFQEKSCGGQGGYKMDYDQAKDMKMKIENTEASWSMTFNNMTATGVIDTNKTNIGSGELYANETDAGIEYVGMDHDKWEDLKGELNPKSIEICVPGEVTRLYHCSNESAISISDCTDVTSYVISGPTYDSTLGCTVFVVPSDLGFSVYFGSTVSSPPPGPGGSGDTGGVSFGSVTDDTTNTTGDEEPTGPTNDTTETPHIPDTIDTEIPGVSEPFEFDMQTLMLVTVPIIIVVIIAVVIVSVMKKRNKKTGPKLLPNAPSLKPST